MTIQEEHILALWCRATKISPLPCGFQGFSVLRCSSLCSGSPSWDIHQFRHLCQTKLSLFLFPWSGTSPPAFLSRFCLVRGDIQSSFICICIPKWAVFLRMTTISLYRFISLLVLIFMSRSMSKGGSLPRTYCSPEATGSVLPQPGVSCHSYYWKFEILHFFYYSWDLLTCFDGLRRSLTLSIDGLPERRV